MKSLTNNKIIYIQIILVLLLFLESLMVSSYKQDPPANTTHQFITNESKEVWGLIPYEIKAHLLNDIRADPNGEISVQFIPCLSENADFDRGDDIITGSGEEDNTLSTCTAEYGNHFWDVDDPNTPLMLGNDDYNDGLGAMGSSYRKALNYWRNDVIPNYLKGNTNESYYYLGRIAHLLEDAAQPSHVLNDPHSGHFGQGVSVLEDYSGNLVFLLNTYDGNSYSGKQYNYENLIEGFNWSTVQPGRTPDAQYIDLFRLFWYTAQKTQYWASDDVNGNRFYVNLSGNTKSWECGTSSSLNLWKNESYSCTYFVNESANLNSGTVEKEANATIPHAMKAVAGLYRLFDDAVRIDWPTDHHDYRRTGFTLLKGDLKTQQKVKSQLNFFLNYGTGTEQVIKPSIADIDGNGFMDMAIAVHKTSNNLYTNLYGTETVRGINPRIGIQEKTSQKWKPIQVQGGAIYFTPTLANIDSDQQKEIITGTYNGTVYAFEYNGPNNPLTQKWAYYLEARFAPWVGSNQSQFNGGSAIVDLDLDGDMEIIIADYGTTPLEANWPGKVYVLEGAGSSVTNKTSYTVGEGGTYDAVSVANVDSDDYPEIIVPTQYGIRVLDYNIATNKLTQKCNTTEGVIEGSAVISDIDLDNEYEIVFTTNDFQCASGKTCTRRLHIINANTCAVEKQVTLPYLAKPTPTVANLDSDSQKEIIVSSVISPSPGLGEIAAIDPISGSTQWTFSAGGTLHPGFVSPTVADIDNDGNFNIILGENSGSTVYILKNDGTLLYSYKVVGFMDNGIAIADLDNDGMAEIAFKRAGSPQTIATAVSNENTPPELIPIYNVTAIAGELINLNSTGKISALDLEADNIQFLYSSPFNSSGKWQTTINDTGNYSIVVEASDGNLSNYYYVDVFVFDINTSRTTTFADGSSNKLLNFTQSGNQSITIRVPKNASIVYSKLLFEGKAP